MNIKVIASGSSGNCYRISDGTTSLLLDAGVPIKQIRIGCDFALSDVSGALVTHKHGDHAKSIPDLIKHGIKVYANQDTLVAFLDQYPHRCKVISNAITDDGQITHKYSIGSFEVIPFDVYHDVPNLGFYLHSTVTGENLLYFTDTYYIKHIFPNLHYIMAEANFSPDTVNQNISGGRIAAEMKKRLVQSHMSIDTLIEMLRKNDLSKVKQIYLLHLSDNNSNEEEFKRRVQSVAGCEVYVC